MGQIHKRPISNEPSPWLKDLLSQITFIPDGPVLDIACGYGRNGALLLSMGFKVHFIDINLEALNFISQSFDKRLTTVIQKDLLNENLGYPSNSVAGIIMVHYFNEPILTEAIDSLKTGGFLYYESIADRGGNYLELPPNKWFRNNSLGRLEFDMYKEHPSKHDKEKSTIRLLGRKIA